MIDKKKVLAIIPARAGSKGVKKKNIKLINNKPLIQYSIDEAKKSKYIDKVIVSTDGIEIANVSKGLGAEIPFIRPENLADDKATTLSVLKHALSYIEDNEGEFDIVVTLQPTSPLRTFEHIDEAIEKLIGANADSLVSIKEVDYHPLWMKNIDDSDKIFDYIKSEINYTRRQDLPVVYQLNGAIFISKRNLILTDGKIYNENTIGYIMSDEESFDIDTHLDFKICEYIIKERERNNG